MNHRNLLVCLLGLAVGLFMSDALAQTRPATDAALGTLIEKLTDRHSDDLFPEDLPDGSKVIDLKGRFQQVPLAQFIGEGQAMVACVNSVEEANTFFGRDLISGSPLPRAASDAHAALVAEALRHGMSVAEYQFYGDLIEQGLAGPEATGSTVTIVNNDGAGEGFNSAAAQFLPAPGNDANANLGEQRLALFNAAAQIWADFLDSSVPIQILAQFDPLTPCSSGGGVLGSAGALGLVSDFTNAEFTNTLYHVALANKGAGIDHSGNPDVSATFNSSVDTGCLGAGSHFYYGLDNATPTDTIKKSYFILNEVGNQVKYQLKNEAEIAEEDQIDSRKPVWTLNLKAGPGKNVLARAGVFHKSIPEALQVVNDFMLKTIGSVPSTEILSRSLTSSFILSEIKNQIDWQRKEASKGDQKNPDSMLESDSLNL